MRRRLLLGIDEGTTAIKAALFDAATLRPVAASRRRVPVTHPAPGRVEQDPELVLSGVVDCVAELLAGIDRDELLGAGLDHQGESVLAWDAVTGTPLTPVVVWQDKRAESVLAEIGPDVPARSGLPLDPYFSAGKLAWLLAHEPALAEARTQGTLRLGTVDAFLRERLGGGFATDLSTASRTQLLAVGGRDWDQQLLAAFGLQREWLPRLGPSFGALAELRCERWPAPLALTAQLVDQQAALAGSGAVTPGELKATYGTGVFVLGPTRGPARVPGLLPTVAWGGPDAAGGIGDVSHAIDGGVFAAGALLDWLADQLGLADDAAELAALAAAVKDSGGALVLPALSGLGAPWWRAQAGCVLAGLHGGTRPAHIARAALEAIAWRVADIVGAIAAEMPVERLRVDGGLTNDATLLQLQADALGLPLEVGRADQTVLGAAMLAGVGAGVFASVAEAVELLPEGRVVEPLLGEDERRRGERRWRAFVEATAALDGLQLLEPRV